MFDAYFRTITIERKTGEDFDTLAWSTISISSDKGFIQPVSGSESFERGKAGERVAYRMYVPMDNTVVQYGDRITQDGQKYIVIFSIQPTGISSTNGHREISLGLFE
jgi:hypothetical protein